MKQHYQSPLALVRKSLSILPMGLICLCAQVHAQWTQVGSDINGEAAGDQCGRAVSMPDANTVAI